MRTKIFGAVVAGGLLVGAGFLTSVVSAPSTASAQETEEDTDRGAIPRALGFLGDVLDGLVGEGTIDRGQADAILDATEAAANEIKAERQAVRELIREFLEDDVITEEEAAQLPDDHWLLGERFDEAWEDGELTRDEIRPHSRRDFFKHGLRLGSLLDDGGIDQSEYDSLPDDHPLKQIDVADYLEDGLITPEELREILSELRNSDQDA